MDGSLWFGVLVIVALIGYSCNLWLPPVIEWFEKKFKKEK